MSCARDNGRLLGPEAGPARTHFATSLHHAHEIDCCVAGEESAEKEANDAQDESVFGGPGTRNLAGGQTGRWGWLLCNFLPDDGPWVKKHELELHIKFFKLVGIVTAITLITREASCALPGWSCVESYGASQYFQFFWAPQCGDLFILFFLGRMYQRPGADTLLFLIACLLGAFLPSAQENISFLRVSLSLYAMMCQWQVSECLCRSCLPSPSIVFSNNKDSMQLSVERARTRSSACACHRDS
jgi:hypothetical protein